MTNVDREFAINSLVAFVREKDMKLYQATLISCLLMSTSLIAQDIRVSGTVSHTLQVPSLAPVQNRNVSQASSPDEIKLLHIKLSHKEKQALAKKTKDALEHKGSFSLSSSTQKSGPYPQTVTLGMNDVPVLNQGRHGSCVTFAITAAVDAALHKGDYISQLCQLQLGNYLANNGYGMSGWDGSYGSFVLAQMDAFGIVNKRQEAAFGCGGLTEYPLKGETPTSSISIEEFHRISEPFTNYFDDTASHEIVWSPLLNMYQAMVERVDTNKVLTDVKIALMAHDRVIFSVLLPALDLGIAGAVGHNKVANDSWVLTIEIARDIYSKPLNAAHEMIITGYDDNAIAIDNTGKAHQGLLTLRNSWGNGWGDHGDFYMSYDYFKLLVIEAIRIRSLSANLSHDDSSLTS